MGEVVGENWTENKVKITRVLDKQKLQSLLASSSTFQSFAYSKLLKPLSQVELYLVVYYPTCDLSTPGL